MKFQDIIVPLIFAFLGTWLIQNFFWSNKGSNEPKSGCEFTAPTSRAYKPLDYDVDFIDNEKPVEHKTTDITTDYGVVTLDNYGASLSSIIYKKIFTDKSMDIKTIDDKQKYGIDGNKNISEDRIPFLVALNGVGSTPYFYNIIDEQKTDSFRSISYKAETDLAIITKEFFIYKSLCKIDLNLTIEPKLENIKQEDLNARIFLPAPHIIGNTQDYVQGLVYTDSKKLIKKSPSKIAQKGWIRPNIFGSEDRYFVNSMIKDTDNFTARAYFKPNVKSKLISILESQPINKTKTWNLSFYLGPKESSYLNAVDSRLEDTIGYGFFWFVSKPLLSLLNLLYDLLHNYGLAIIALALIINILLLPISLKAAQAQQKTAQMQRKLKYLEQRYKNDSEALMRAKFELIKDQGGGTIFTMLSFLPQIPIFIGLNRVLGNAIELYGAKFLWINNLSNADPYYILPILFSIGIIMSTVTSSSKGIKDARQGLAMGLFSIVLGALFANFASGLVLYFVVNTWFRVFQNYIQPYFKKYLN